MVEDPQLPLHLPGVLAVLEGPPVQELLQPHAHPPGDWVLEDEGPLARGGGLEQSLPQLLVPLLGVLAAHGELHVHEVLLPRVHPLAEVELEDEDLLGEEDEVDLLLPVEAIKVAFVQGAGEEDDLHLGDGGIQVGRLYL